MPAVITHVDETHDLALVKVAAFVKPAVELRSSNTLAVGEQVYAIGSPEGLELSLSEGIISGLRLAHDARLIQTTAAISHGSSGGGLFDADGHLIGITTFTIENAQGLNFAIPAEHIRDLDRHPYSGKGRRAGSQSGLDLGNIMGRQLTKADLQALISAAGEQPEISRSGKSQYLVFNRGGLEVELKDRVVENVWIYLRASTKHGAFNGSLRFGVRRTDDRASLNRKFGLPSRSGGGDEDPFRDITGDEYIPIHDNWRFPRVEFHAEYDDQGGISLLCLMRRSAS